jgi:hypothetical protein
MRSVTVSGSATRLVVDNEAQTVTLLRGRQTVTIVAPEHEIVIPVGGMFDFSNFLNSGLLALLEDI